MSNPRHTCLIPRHAEWLARTWSIRDISVDFFFAALVVVLRLHFFSLKDWRLSWQPTRPQHNINKYKTPRVAYHASIAQVVLSSELIIVIIASLSPVSVLRVLPSFVLVGFHHRKVGTFTEGSSFLTFWPARSSSVILPTSECFDRVFGVFKPFRTTLTPLLG